MSTALLFITDGRPCAEQTLASAAEHLPPLDACVIVDDSDHELGFAGAIAAGWEAILQTGCDFVFHLEDDFTFNAPVPLESMGQVLKVRPHIAQVALKRQPWSEEERAAGGVIEAHPDDFSSARAPVGIGAYLYYTEHRRFFTTNPSLYRASLCEQGWPQEPESEGKFTARLLGQGYRFAYWGGKADPPVCEHIGQRAGVGY